jgi:hypothetical protein
MEDFIAATCIGKKPFGHGTHTLALCFKRILAHVSLSDAAHKCNGVAHNTYALISTFLEFIIRKSNISGFEHFMQ